MDNNVTGASPSTAKPSPEDRLDSWKEIAAYLMREVRTVQRWEKTDGLPVHRLQLTKQGPVYAYKSELDSWFRGRERGLEAEAKQEEGSRTRTRLRMPFSIVGGLLAVAMLVTVGAYFAGNGRWLNKRPAAQRIKLVVLPLLNLSGDSAQEYFTDGMTEEIITQLGKLDPERLGVIASESSKLFGGKPIADVGRALGVQYALEGSVRRDGNRVRIDVQLIQVSDETHLWAESYDRDLNDILRVQDDVGAAVASRIPIALKPPNSRTAFAVTKRTVNPEAYDAYLRGRFYWTKRGDLHKSIEAYQEAIQKDPQYALAYAGLATAFAVLGQAPYDDVSPSEARPRAREAAERALQLDPQLTEAHVVLANVALSYDWNFDTAEREFQQALALGPNNPIPYSGTLNAMAWGDVWYGRYCIVRNRLSQALEENSRALDLDRVSPLLNIFRAEIHYYARNFDAAIDQARRTIEQYPTYTLGSIWLGSAYRQKKMYREALEAFTQGRKLSGDNPVAIALYGHSLALAGDATGARKALSELQRLALSRYVSPIYFAAIYLGLGEKSTALDWLDKAYAEHSDRLVYLGVEPMADPLRSEPRFRDLLRRMGLPQCADRPCGP